MDHSYTLYYLVRYCIIENRWTTVSRSLKFDKISASILCSSLSGASFTAECPRLAFSSLMPPPCHTLESPSRHHARGEILNAYQLKGRRTGGRAGSMSKSISQADPVDVCNYGTNSAPHNGDIDEDGGLRDGVQVHATYVDAAGHSYPI